MSVQEMKSFPLFGKEDMRLEMRPVPEPKAGDVLIKIQRTGICGSDIHYYEHGYCGAYIPKRPFVLGHEFSGDIVEVGEGVTDFKVGDRVTVDPSQPCYVCKLCKSGHYNLCPHFKYLGTASVDPHVDGSFSEYMTMPAINCYRLPESVDYNIAALMEPLSVALHAAMRPGTVAGQTVMIAGAGTIGQMVLVCAKAFGAAKIVVSDIIDHQRAFSLEQGADAVLDPLSENVEEEARELSKGGFDVIFEVSGAQAALQQAIHFSRRGGTIVQVGTLPDKVTIPANLIMVKELSLLGTLRFANVFSMALDMAASGRFNLQPLITKTYPFDQVVEAMQFACKREKVIKVQVEY